MKQIGLYLRKASNKLIKTFLKQRKVYELIELMIGSHRASLPSLSDSETLLLRVEPYHELGKARERLWPSDPEIQISVIVPCFNVERYIESCLNSIASQVTSRSFEIVAVDDGSTDNTGAILDEISTRVTTLNVIHQPNQGFSGARNTGIANAKGAYLVFVDSDDLLKPGALEKLANSISSSGTDFVTASYDNMSEDGREISPIDGRRQHGAPWARIYSRDVWWDVDFPEGYWFEDTIQGFIINPRFSQDYLDDSVYLYRNNSEGITARCSLSKKGLDSFWIVKALLNRAELLGIPYDQKMHDRVVKQLGPILWWRCAALNSAEKKALFICACDLYLSRAGNMSCSFGGLWNDLERAFASGTTCCGRLRYTLCPSVNVVFISKI